MSQAISHGAMHDCAERDPSLRCHPDTREKVTEGIVCWIEEPTPSSIVLWVSGRAGVGKSALMQNSKGYISVAAFSLGGAHPDAT